MKKLQMPYNSDLKILDLYLEWKDYIAEIYFPPSPNIFPTARHLMIKDDKKYFLEIQTLLKFCKKNNINSMLLLNGINIVFTDEKLKEIKNFLSKLEKDLDGVIIANTIFAHWVHLNFPKLKIRLSILSLQNSIQQIKQISNMGYIQEICLPQWYNRNIEELKEIVKENPNINFSSIVNSTCRAYCPGYNWHHGFFNSNINPEDEIDFGKTFLKFSSDEGLYQNILKSPFILPSDLSFYDNFYHQFKLEDRNCTTEELHSFLISYATRINGDFLSSFLHGSCLPAIMETVETKKLPFWWSKKVKNCKNECWKCNICENLLKEMGVKIHGKR